LGVILPEPRDTGNAGKVIIALEIRFGCLEIHWP